MAWDQTNSVVKWRIWITIMVYRPHRLWKGSALRLEATLRAEWDRKSNQEINESYKS